MSTSLFRNFVSKIILFILIFSISSCSPTQASTEPSLSPTPDVPGHSSDNPVPFGESLIQQIGTREPKDYMEIRPINFMGPEDFDGSLDTFIRIAWPHQSGNPAPEAGNRYVLVMIDFLCISGVGEEDDCEFSSFKVMDKGGNEYRQELHLWSEIVGWHFINATDRLSGTYKLKTGDNFSGAAIFEVDKKVKDLLLIYDNQTTPLYWTLPPIEE